METWRKNMGCALVKPSLKLPHRNQPPSAAADDPELVHHVLLEEVDADTQGLRGLGL
jgi:hypothetical protein